MTERALLQAIRDNPDDDLPRLAHADWLEEQDTEVSLACAGFIRAQIDLTNAIAKARANSPHMRCLTTLHPNTSRLTGPGAFALAHSPHLVNLSDEKKPELKELYNRRYHGHYW